MSFPCSETAAGDDSYIKLSGSMGLGLGLAHGNRTYGASLRTGRPAQERRIKLNNRIEILERRIQEEDSAEVNEMVRTAKVTPEQLAALLRQSANTTPNPAALSAVGATFEKEDANED